MEKIKPLKPSLREKKRYIAFEVISKKNFTFLQTSKAILDSVLKYTGIKGLAEMGLVLLKEKYFENKGVIRVSSKKVNSLKAAFTLTKGINKEPVIVRSLGVSGILQKTNKLVS